MANGVDRSTPGAGSGNDDVEFLKVKEAKSENIDEGFP